MVIVRHDLMGSFPLQMADHGLSMRVTYYFPKKKHQPHLTKQVQNQTKHVNVRNTKNLNMLLWEGTKMVKGPPPKKMPKPKERRDSYLCNPLLWRSSHDLDTWLPSLKLTPRASHLKSYLPKRQLIFQPSIFRCEHVSFREGNLNEKKQFQTQPKSYPTNWTQSNPTDLGDHLTQQVVSWSGETKLFITTLNLLKGL